MRREVAVVWGLPLVPALAATAVYPACGFTLLPLFLVMAFTWRGGFIERSTALLFATVFCSAPLGIYLRVQSAGLRLLLLMLLITVASRLPNLWLDAARDRSLMQRARIRLVIQFAVLASVLAPALVATTQTMLAIGAFGVLISLISLLLSINAWWRARAVDPRSFLRRGSPRELELDYGVGDEKEVFEFQPSTNYREASAPQTLVVYGDRLQALAATRLYVVLAGLATVTTFAVARAIVLSH